MLPYLGHEFIACLTEVQTQDEALDRDLAEDFELPRSSRKVNPPQKKERVGSSHSQPGPVRFRVFAVYFENCAAMRLFRKMFA